jgi:basic membrane protein A
MQRNSIMTLLLCLLTAAFLFACSMESEETTSSEEQAAVESEAADEMKVGFVYVSPVGDAGWSYAHDEGRKVVEAMPGVTTSFVESVPEGPDAERVIANMAQKGFDVVFTTSFGYMDPTLKIAGQNPDKVFMHCSGFKTADNMGNYFGRMYQARYLTGLVAGSMTKANIIGYVAAFPIPEVIRGINAFTLGAQKMNPDVEVRVVWTKTWYDPVTEKEAAKSLLDVGADVIAQHQDSPGPQEAAQEKGVFSVGYNTDMSSFAPEAHLTAPIWNWGVLYKDIIEQVQAGTWKSEALWWGMDKGIVDIAPLADMVPEEVKFKVGVMREALQAGNDTIFTGPIFDQKGELKIAEGVKAEDGELLGMTWFVKGVIGTVE